MREDGRTTYVVGDVHGHLDELLGALAGAGLIDNEANWSGGDAHVWFLGDFVDRGPDGIGVIDLVMRLATEADAAGGQVQALLGNHEILLLGMHRFGDTEVPSDFGPRSFARSWEMNGGQPTDQEAVTDSHIEWLSSRPALAVVEEHLLMHSDTLEYLVWGSDVEEINAGIQDVLRSDDIVEWWEVWRRLTTRHAFRGPFGGEVAGQLLAVLGGDQVVHGHSVIADQLGVAPAQIETPFEYAEGRALGVDGGVFVGGPCLVVRLPFDGKPAEEALPAPAAPDATTATSGRTTGETTREPSGAVVGDGSGESPTATPGTTPDETPDPTTDPTAEKTAAGPAEPTPEQVPTTQTPEPTPETTATTDSPPTRTPDETPEPAPEATTATATAKTPDETPVTPAKTPDKTDSGTGAESAEE